MMSHRSGLPDHAGDMLEDLGYDRRQVLDRLRQLPLDPFRISYAYTNFGFTAGAEAVAVNAGKPWEDARRRGAVRPARHGATSYRFTDYEAGANRAVGHIHSDGRYEPSVRPRRRRGSPGGRSEFVGERHDALAGDGPRQRQPRGQGDRRHRRAAARAHATDRVQSRDRTRDAVRLLRIRLQRLGFIGSPHGAQPFGRVRTRRRNELPDPAVGRRGDRRAHQCHAVGGARGLDRRVRRSRAVR